ncbi:MAG TPA: B12-binding domain-containing radical SAM protein [Verrucomicrobia bacterium]|nr:B12-binding domain-containing radical SAM protein [Verrucomicrobiota bacterium]
MRILLVRPPRPPQSITLGAFMYGEPIGLEIVYAVLSPHHEVRILDMMVEPCDIAEVCREWTPDVVGLTSLCIDVVAVLDLARQVKTHAPGIITVAGGTQAYFDPASFHDPAIDHIMVYTTRQNLLVLFGCLAQRQPVPMIDGVQSAEQDYRSTGVAGRNEAIAPDRTSTALYRQHYSYFGFKPCALMQTSQGCRRQCHFCLRWRLEGATEQNLPMDAVTRQIAEIEEPAIMIFDNDFLHNADRLNTLCDWLEETGTHKHFICYGSVHSIVHNTEAVARFARHGLRAVLVGYESFSEDELKTYRKGISTDDNLRAARILKSCRIDAWASFIMHPDWTAEDFARFRKYVRRLKPDISSLTPLTPFFSSPLYEQYADRLLFAREDYTKWSFGQVSIRPSRMPLDAYYRSVLLTNLYINFFMNNAVYIVRRFGLSALLRILPGSIRLSLRYIRLMHEARNETSLIRLGTGAS